jgi:hypothetical protein
MVIVCCSAVYQKLRHEANGDWGFGGLTPQSDFGQGIAG